MKTGIVKIEVEKVTIEPFAWSDELTAAEKRTLAREIQKADYSNELTYFSLDNKTMGFETPNYSRVQKSYSRKIY